MPTRSGKHRPDKVCMAMYVDPELRSVICSVKKKTGLTFTEIMTYGIISLGISSGVIQRGDEYAVKIRKTQ